MKFLDPHEAACNKLVPELFQLQLADFVRASLSGPWKFFFGVRVYEGGSSICFAFPFACVVLVCVVLDTDCAACRLSWSWMEKASWTSPLALGSWTT